MGEAIVLFTSTDPVTTREVHQTMATLGVRITQMYGPSVIIIEDTANLASTLRAQQGVRGVFEESVPDELCQNLDHLGQLGVEAWNARHSASFQSAKKHRKGEGLSWGHADFERQG